MKDGNGEPILDKDGNFRYCTDCLNYPLDSNKCSVKLYDYKDQTSAE